MTVRVEFPPEAAKHILSDWRRFIGGGFREVDYTPTLNFFFHLIGLFDEFNPQAIDAVWSFYFDGSLRNTMTFWDDVLALKRPRSFHDPAIFDLVQEMQGVLAEVLAALKAEAQQILEEAAWSIAQDRWDEARDDLLADQPQLTVAQQNDHLPEFGELIDEDEVDPPLTERVRRRLESAVRRVKASGQARVKESAQVAVAPTLVTQPGLWHAVRQAFAAQSQRQTPSGATTPGASIESSPYAAAQKGEAKERNDLR